MPSVKAAVATNYAPVFRKILAATAFSGARFRCGNRKLAEETFTRVDKQRDIAAFVEAKLVGNAAAP